MGGAWLSGATTPCLLHLDESPVNIENMLDSCILYKYSPLRPKLIYYADLVYDAIAQM